MLKSFCLALVLACAALVTPASAQDGGTIVQECYDAGVSSKACRSVEQLLKNGGRTCRMAAPPDECAIVDGRFIDRRLVRAYEQSWAPRALALQRGLDDVLPMSRELWVHTHNSFNAEAYLPTFSGLDSNQVYSLTDQLRMGVRALEIDVHWAPSPDGLPEDGFMAPIACHGEPIGLGPAAVHFGCTTEVHLRTRLAEVADWLGKNPGEVVLLYLENNLDGAELAHQRAVEAIEATIGDVVRRPSGSGCEALPVDTSRAEIRALGKRVLLTGNCGPGSWGTYVFERGPRWIERKSAPGTDYPDMPDCVGAEREPREYGTNWIRFYEDSTWLSAMVDGTGLGGPGEITPPEARRMVRCGVNMPGFDQLRPFDPRLDAVVWSWAPGEPSSGACAYARTDGLFAAGGCDVEMRFACFDEGAGWTLTDVRGPWELGSQACASAGSGFAVPRDAFDSELLRAAKGEAQAWINYRAVGGHWEPGA